MIKNSKMADIAMIITGIIWGTGFIGTEFAIETGAKTSLIITMRFMFAGLIMLAVYFKDLKKIDKKTFKVGTTAGVILFFGFYIQTFGQAFTSVSNSSFLTSTNVIMIPFIVFFITKKMPSLKYFLLAFTTLIGAFVLTMDFSQGFVFKMGDIAVVISALCFALHISYLGIFSKDLNKGILTFLQLMTTGIIALVFMLAFDFSAVDFEIIKAAFLPTLYLAVFSTCICYYLQTSAQQYASPAKAGIFLSTEGFFGSMFSVMLGIDMLTVNLFVGGVIILGSVILAEIDFKPKNTPSL